jgi:putative PIN family toxin of toxin-antitoxin system
LKLVLDTNIVLDWLHFAQPALEPLHHGLQEHRVCVFTHAVILDELRRVLSFSQFKLDPAARLALIERYQSLTVPIAVENPTVLPEAFPRCRDPDDDKFLAVAYHAGADALLSRDKALLKLRRRSARLGFQIMNASQLIETLSGNPTST